MQRRMLEITSNIHIYSTAYQGSRHLEIDGFHKVHGCPVVTSSCLDVCAPFHEPPDARFMTLLCSREEKMRLDITWSIAFFVFEGVLKPFNCTGYATGINDFDHNLPRSVLRPIALADFQKFSPTSADRAPLAHGICRKMMVCGVRLRRHVLI